MAPISIQPGSRLGKYEIVEHLASGGMGAVFKAVDKALGRLVALKILAAPLVESDLAVERFRREARHAARLNHPNIVTVYEFGRDDTHAATFLAFEFIHGIDLARYIATRGQLAPEEVRRILVQVAKALGHAFEHSIVHRDIKPANIMLAHIDGKVRVKLTDLGLAITRGEDDFRITREGSTVGTIDYLAPEQARDSQAVDTRSDIYALGCTAYHMLAGRAPFAEGGLGERLFKHLEAPPPDVRHFNPAVSAAFWAVLERMLAKRPEDRYANPLDLTHALKRVNTDAIDSSRTVLPISSERRMTEHASIGPTQLSIGTPPVAGKVSSEQGKAASAFCERAIQVLTRGDGDDYARKLLHDCLKLDPFNIAGRKALRALNRKNSAGVLGRWFGSLSVVAIKSKMRLAQTTGDWRKVFEYGEQLLVHQPSDVDTHIMLAETATDLGLPDLARWFLEQGRQFASGEQALAVMLRAQARLHEHLHQWRSAANLWKQVVALEPSNYEAQRKLNDLSAQAMLVT